MEPQFIKIDDITKVDENELRIGITIIAISKRGNVLCNIVKQRSGWIWVNSEGMSFWRDKFYSLITYVGLKNNTFYLLHKNINDSYNGKNIPTKD